ncbi:MAG TPA: polysaccharide deacetylase family protein [Noviherbaspirillum sp.]|uniref:polysaccharide deacetylase family protein n=1 Tax=Noviherbaspirillum sp. TaxID=1926288 RepID=UPI002DDDACE9|nr:polysaccharide deacetylase family protein [Noviherbaspirillum sp.]HEV2612827.1 polysaccharide deacetylase family protein [Noviherbaspirillum sp.]
MGLLFTYSIDDGNPSDLRMAELLSKHGINGTFYIPIRNSEGDTFPVMSDAQMREVGSQFEIGAHTYDHCRLKNLGDREAHFQIVEGKRHLENLLGRPITGFCYPGGKYGKRDVDAVKACGFHYARTTMNLRFDAGNDIFQIPTTIQFYPHSRSVYLRNFIASGNWSQRRDGLMLAMRHDDWMDRMYALFDHACKHNRVFHLWTHSKDIDQLDAWKKLDGFMAHVAANVRVQDRLNNGQLAEKLFNRRTPAGLVRPGLSEQV